MNAQLKLNRYYLTSTGPVLINESVLKELKSASPSPIKLTKQWLIAFGFQPDSSGYYWVFEDCRLIQGVNCWLCVYTRRYLRHVDELQDLFEDSYKYTDLRLKTGLAGLHVPTVRRATV